MKNPMVRYPDHGVFSWTFLKLVFLKRVHFQPLPRIHKYLDPGRNIITLSIGRVIDPILQETEHSSAAD